MLRGSTPYPACTYCIKGICKDYQMCGEYCEYSLQCGGECEICWSNNTCIYGRGCGQTCRNNDDCIQSNCSICLDGICDAGLSCGEPCNLGECNPTSLCPDCWKGVCGLYPCSTAPGVCEQKELCPPEYCTCSNERLDCGHNYGE